MGISYCYLLWAWSLPQPALGTYGISHNQLLELMELYQSLKLSLLANEVIQKVAVDFLSFLSLAMPGIYDPSFGVWALLWATKKYILFASLQQHVKESNSCD
jgi:hypothetical protein